MFWIWMGLAYHFWFFSTLNRAALIFAAFFVLQGVLFFFAGVWKEQLGFRFTINLHGIVVGAFLLYALVIYPALGYWLGHRYPAAPTFGIPCPTMIFTFGMLLLTDSQSSSLRLGHTPSMVVRRLLGSDFLGMTEDYGLLAAGLLGSLLIILRAKHARVRSASLTALDCR